MLKNGGFAKKNSCPIEVKAQLGQRPKKIFLGCTFFGGKKTLFVFLKFETTRKTLCSKKPTFSPDPWWYGTPPLVACYSMFSFVLLLSIFWRVAENKCGGVENMDAGTFKLHNTLMIPRIMDENQENLLPTF